MAFPDTQSTTWLTFRQWELDKVGEDCLCSIVGRALGKLDQTKGETNEGQIFGHFTKCRIFFLSWEGELIVVGFPRFLRCLRVPTGCDPGGVRIGLNIT